MVRRRVWSRSSGWSFRRTAPGHAAFVLTDPLLKGAADAVNTCFTDNEPLARYLLSDFVQLLRGVEGHPGARAG